MRQAVIVSTARTPIGRAYRGAFNNTQGATLAGHVLAQAVSRAGIDPGEVEDVIMGCALQQGTTGGNVARQAAVRAGLPVTTAGTTVDRQCSSGLQAISIASQRVDVRRPAGRYRRRAGQHQPGAERAHEPVPRPRRMADGPQARDLHGDDRHRRDGGAALPDHPRGAGRVRAGKPAPHRRRPGSRPVRCRDRADGKPDGDDRQGDRRGQPPCGHAEERRGQPRRRPRWTAWPRSSRCAARAM